jgi:hypothetical protein
LLRAVIVAPSPVIAEAVNHYTSEPETLATSLLDYAARLDHVQRWIEPNTVAGYEAFGQVLAIVDQAWVDSISDKTEENSAGVRMAGRFH